MSRLRAALAIAAVTLVASAAAGCGEGKGTAHGPLLAWDGKPKLTVSPSGAHVVVGVAKNGSSDQLWIRTPELRIVDREGRRIRSSVTFASGFVRSNYPRNGPLPSRPSRYPLAEQQRIGFLAEIKPGKSVPLTVSWQEPRGPRTATRLVYKSASLPIPSTPTYSP